ncbi:MAG: cysteine synthase family protein [Planctomycetes bacterium]|nr:cysteine synthase family protein [Planctomycetota bacterium]
MIYGNTPLVETGGIFAKLECTNPCGSIKDRIAKYIIDKSQNLELLKPGMKIVEATSGNTGIALSHYATQKGYHVTIVMPGNMSEERKQIIQALGAELVLCSDGDFSEAAAIRNKMAEDPEYFNPDQFSNPLNIECHYLTTGQEILRQILYHRTSIDAFVAGVGTGGTLIGVGQALKAIYPNIHLVAVEPSESPVMSGGTAGSHGIFGIGDGFIPAIATNGNGGLNPLIDEVICVSTDDSRDAANEIRKKFGYCVGMSSGANYRAAQQLNRRFETVVTVFADGYEKYHSVGLKPCQQDECDFKQHHSCLPDMDNKCCNSRQKTNPSCDHCVMRDDGSESKPAW